MLVLAGAPSALMAYRYLQIDRIDLEEGVLDDEDHNEPQNLLLIGSDSRAFVEGVGDAAAFGTEDEVGPPKADVILVARTFPDEGRVALMSFPRDLWTPIAGTGEEGRINSAIEGGASRLIETLGVSFGIPIHHVVQIDFRGFKGLVDAVGGVEVYFPSPVRDWDREKRLSPTGLSIQEGGCVRLDGDTALAYVRSRHYERFIDGEWHPDPTGDLNRISRQQDFIRRTLRQALSRGLADPRRLDSVARSVNGLVEISENLGAGDLLRFGERFRSLSADALESYALPTTPGTTPRGAQVLFLQADAAEPVLDVFRGRTDRPAVLLPGSVRVRIEDGTGGRTTLNAAAFRLAAAGFSVANTGDTARAAKTVLRFGPGQHSKAELVAGALVGPVQLVEDAELAGVDVVLVLGRDWRGVREELPVPSTTAPSGGSTTTALEQTPATPPC